MVRSGRAVAQIAGFIAHLRRHGFTLGPAETELVLSVLAADEFVDANTARLALKTLLSGNRDQWSRFDALFDAYWLGRGLKVVDRAATEGDHPRGSTSGAMCCHPTQAREPPAKPRASLGSGRLLRGV